MKVRDFRIGNFGIEEFFDGLEKVGLQASLLKRASDIITSMIREDADIFLSFTSNLVTSGLRGLFAQMMEKGMPSFVVTTAGAVEEDIMRALGEEFLILEDIDDYRLHGMGINRVGNLGIRNVSYERLEGFLKEVLDEIAEEEKEWSVSGLLAEIGKRLDDKNSILYWSAKKGIPVFCPGITDGSIGFHLYLAKKRSGLKVDVVEDFGKMVALPSFDRKKGIISLGGGISKHHALLASLLSGGADYAVYITTSSSKSGSMSAAGVKEAVSWGKVKHTRDSVEIRSDASIVFPLVMWHVFKVMGWLDS